MDKYEYKVKLAQIEKLVNKKDYVTAAKIADGVDWRKVKSVKTLTMIADVYEETDRTEDCYEILTMVYDRSPIARSVIYRLAEISVKMHDFEEAISFYKEFVEIAPNDLSRYILKYRIYRERGSSVMDQIAILQEFKNHEYDEQWAYELACLYEEAGMIDQCISECNELILWFSEGEYVVKALELKMKYEELTAAQQDKYEHRFDTREETEEQTAAVEEFEPEEAVKAEAVTEEVIPEAEETVEEEPEGETVSVSDINTGKFSTINLQAELAKGLQFILSEIEQETAKAEPEEVIPQTKQPEAESAEKKETKPKNLTETAELQNEILKYTSVEQAPTLEEMLRVEEDGQISLDVNDESLTNRQITGQMTIEEILEAWEIKKRQMEEQIEATEQKMAILCETGEITSILDDFMPRTPKDIGSAAEPEKTVLSEMETVQEQLEEVPELEDDLPEEINFEDVFTDSLEETEIKEAEKEEVLKKVTGDTASMIDAIERALAFETTPTETLGRYLTDDEEKIFAYFTSVSGMKKQLVKLLGEDFRYAGRKDSAEGNLIITGHPGNGKTTLAIDIVKAIQRQRQVKGGKLAKVTGDGLNKKEPAEVLKKLGGGAMVIERAGALNAETTAKLSDAMKGDTGGLLVILEDAKSEIDRILKQNESFAAKFKRSIDIPIFSNDELVAFGKSYAEELEYYFDEMAVLALYDSIGVRQTSDHVVNITEVKELIDDAVAHAEKRAEDFLQDFQESGLMNMETNCFWRKIFKIARGKKNQIVGGFYYGSEKENG